MINVGLGFSADAFTAGHCEAVRLDAVVLSRNVKQVVRLVEVSSPQLVALGHPRIVLVAVQEEIGHVKVVAGPEVRIPQSDRRVGGFFGLVNSGQDSLCETEPFLVPTIKISGFDLWHNLEDFRDVCAIVGHGREGAHCLIVEVEVFVEFQHGWVA